MSKKISGGILTILMCISVAFSAAKFPFPQQASYANGILPEGISHVHVQNVYDIWLKGYYEESGDLARIKFDTPSQTVSEGIAYGMLIMVYPYEPITGITCLPFWSLSKKGNIHLRSINPKYLLHVIQEGKLGLKHIHSRMYYGLNPTYLSVFRKPDG